MILDERSEFADALAIPTSANAVALLGDVIDLGLGQKVGSGDYSDFYVSVDTTITGATSVKFDLVSDAQAAIAVDGSATIHGSTGALPVARLTAGAIFSFQLPKGFNYERYLGVIVTVVGTATAGKVNAGFAAEAGGWAAINANTGY